VSRTRVGRQLSDTENSEVGTGNGTLPSQWLTTTISGYGERSRVSPKIALQSSTIDACYPQFSLQLLPLVELIQGVNLKDRDPLKLLFLGVFDLKSEVHLVTGHGIFSRFDPRFSQERKFSGLLCFHDFGVI